MAQVFLGMSGGVDSSAAAVLLQEQGYAVSGLHLSLLSGLPLPADRLPDDGSDARAVASLLGLPFYDMDLLPEISGNGHRLFHPGIRGGPHPKPLRILQPEDQVRRHVGRRPKARGGLSGHRPLRQNPTGSCHRPSPALPGGGPFQGPELLSLPFDAGAAFPDAVLLGRSGKTGGTGLGGGSRLDQRPKAGQSGYLLRAGRGLCELHYPLRGTRIPPPGRLWTGRAAS